MGKTLQNLFKSYCSQLLKLDLLMAGKQDLIAVEEASLKSVFTSKVRNILLIMMIVTMMMMMMIVI